MSDIICVTNRKLCNEDFLKRIDRIAACHPAGIILREKDLTKEAYEELAVSVMKICSRHNVKCILHSFVDVALQLKADAIHLPLHLLREMTEKEKSNFSLIGASCHSIEDAKEAQMLGCTYITAGHIFETDCKKGLAGRGLSFLQGVCNAVSIPVYGIGGIDSSNISEVRACGASGACLMSSLMVSEDVKGYIKKMKFNKEMLLLYAVTDRAWVGKQTLLEQIESALKGGATIVQLREKKLDEEEFVKEAIAAKKICHQYGVPLIINDNVEVALKSGADGVHVGVEDTPIEEIRKRVPADFIIGATCKTVEQAQLAEKCGADYMGVGAVFPSSTKSNAVRITNEQLKEIVSSVSIPAVAIGGISYDNVCEIKGSKISGVAVVSAIFGEKDIEMATAKLKEKVKTVV